MQTKKGGEREGAVPSPHVYFSCIVNNLIHSRANIKYRSNLTKIQDGPTGFVIFQL